MEGWNIGLRIINLEIRWKWVFRCIAVLESVLVFDRELEGWRSRVDLNKENSLPLEQNKHSRIQRRTITIVVVRIIWFATFCASPFL